MQFYHNIITQKSFEFLQKFNQEYDFILIGGWAVFLYSHSLKSKDIDIIIEYQELARLKEKYEVFKNDRLKKYEIKSGEFDIDIYLPHYSELGIDLSRIKKTAQNREGFHLPKLEILFLLKLHAWQNRQGSTKGRKDELDLLSLALLPEFDWREYKNLIKKNNLQSLNKQFLSFLKNTTRAEELKINEQKIAKTRKGILKELGEK
ncbi:hypothetical protein L6279_02720 [Candidatus Parcubacteria bacterium]|nr:hypothetical protein [Candidatus Parcubacteria bacterium]